MEAEPLRTRGNKYVIPAAVLIAGFLIAVAAFYSGGGSSVGDVNSGQGLQQPSSKSKVEDNIRPVSASDHILGDPSATVKLVEFSDLECPFCKRFHPIMQDIMEEYGRSGKVAWVYRHFPLDVLHSKARKEAQATECVNELGGNVKFWEYADRIFEITPSNDGFDLSLLPKIAEDIGINRAQFESCLNSDKYVQHIEDDYQDAVASGGTGTPYNIIIASNGKKFPFTGALPYSAVKSLIELALKEE